MNFKIFGNKLIQYQYLETNSKNITRMILLLRKKWIYFL